MRGGRRGGGENCAMERGRSVIYRPHAILSPPTTRTRSHWWDSGSFTNIGAMLRISAAARPVSGTWEGIPNLTEVLAYRWY